MNVILPACIYPVRDSFGAPWRKDAQYFFVGESGHIIRRYEMMIAEVIFSNSRCHVQRTKRHRDSRCGPRCMKFHRVNFHIPMKKQELSQFNISREVVLIIIPHFLATCLSLLLFWHKSCLCLWTHHIQFEVFLHFSISLLVWFLDLLGPSGLSSRARANTTFFFTVTFESYGLSWTWRSLPVPWLCCKYLSWPPTSI